MRRPQSLLVLILGLMILLSSSVASAAPTPPPPVPGWTHSPRFQPDDFPQQQGVLLSGGDVVRSSPVIADINGSAADGNEVAIGGRDGMVYALRSNGQLLWSLNVLPNPACAASGSDFKLNSSPAVGTIFGDDVPYVVIGYGTILSSECDGGVVAIDGRTGAIKWRFSLRSWAASQGYSEGLYGVLSSPALADTDGDGRLEIGFGGFDRNVYLLNADGSVRWYYHAADTVWSSPAFTNVDGDPQLEMVIGTDISTNPDIFPPNPEGGFVYAFDTQQRTPRRIEYAQGFIWRTFFDQAVYSSPAIGDVLSSNPGLEIVSGSSCSADKGGKWIKILRLSDGALLQMLNAQSCIPSSPALGDIDGDGQLEIVAAVQGEVSTGGDGKSRITAWKATNPTPIWSVIPVDSGGANDPYGADIQSPILADLDGNGSLEVITANVWSLVVLNGKTGQHLTCTNSNTCGTQIAISAAKTLKSTPAVGDINGDGKLDLVVGGGHVFNNERGMLYAWTDFAGRLNSPAGTLTSNSRPWPMWRHNPQHTGVLTQPRIVASPSSASVLVAVRQQRTLRFSFSNADGSPITWNVSENDPNNMLQLSRTSGSSSDALQITVNAPNTRGTYNATLTISADGLPNISVPITVIAVDRVYTTLLPVIQR